MAQVKSRTVTFKVATAGALPTGEQVFIAGDREELGAWRPDGVPLTRVDECLWSGQVTIADCGGVRFKVTRGTWDTEQVDRDGQRVAETEIKAGADETVSMQVYDWFDHRGGPTPQITGNYRVHEAVTSRYVRGERRVIVWLPPSYEAAVRRRYPVTYIHDGQQIFDPQTSTWGQDWEVDEWCTKLIEAERMQEVIVVAVYNTPDREAEYDPAKAGPEYGRFLLEELKPQIDAEYRTLPGRETTAVAGSSRGGEIAFYLAWTHPDVFFGAACLSPVFKYKGAQHCLDMVRKGEAPKDLKLYLYCGGADGLEQELLPGVREMADLITSRGLASEGRLLVVEDPSREHNERAWAGHTDEWLLFLFGK